jgi:aryl sulfotransferase
MTILQAGFRKSGNFWLWNIIEHTLKQARLPQKSFVQKQPIYKLAKTWDLAFDAQPGMDFISISPEVNQYQIVPVFYWPIEDMKKYVRQTTHVWTHSAARRDCIDTFKIFDKIVYVMRDPRDVAVSFHRFAHNAFHKRFYGTKDKRSPQQDWGVHVIGFLNAVEELGAHVIFYEHLLLDWDRAYGELLDYLEIELSPKKREAVRKATSFATMKKRSKLHLARGEAYGWVDELSGKEQKDFTYIHDRFLALLGYPMTAAEARKGVLPVLPTREQLAEATPNLWALDAISATI